MSVSCDGRRRDEATARRKTRTSDGISSDRTQASPYLQPLEHPTPVILTRLALSALFAQEVQLLAMTLSGGAE